MRLKGWRSEVALADITGYIAVTRCTDPVKNTDKYRRFITLSTPGENHLHVHHTGRWTTRTSQGRWIEGVWRPQGVAKTSTMRRLPGTDDYNEEMVRRKLGDYQVVQPSRMMTTSEIQDVINRADLVDDSPAPTVANPTPVEAQPLRRPISGQPVKEPGKPHPHAGRQTSTPVVAIGGLLSDLNNLRVRVSGDEDVFDLLADLAAINRQVKVMVDEARQLEDELKLTTEMIVAKAGMS